MSSSVPSKALEMPQVLKDYNNLLPFLPGFFTRIHSPIEGQGFLSAWRVHKQPAHHPRQVRLSDAVFEWLVQAFVKGLQHRGQAARDDCNIDFPLSLGHFNIIGQVSSEGVTH